jgi:chalcone synthase
LLVVSSEVITMALRGPSEAHKGNFVGLALFGDAAGAAVVRAGEERPVFEMASAWQDIIPGTEGAVVSELREEGRSSTPCTRTWSCTSPATSSGW